MRALQVAAFAMVAFSAALLIVWSVRYAAPVAMLVGRMLLPRLRRATA